MPFSYHSRKYALNENFFSNWSPKMAYVLGFWFADGYMRHDRSYRITFSSHDREHLESIKKVVETNIPLIQYKSHGRLDQNFTLYLRSNFTSGSPKFLNALRDLLTKKLGLYSRKVCIYGNGNQWKLGYCGADTIKLLKFMYYSGCKLFLTRKEIYSHYERINRSLWQVKTP